MNDQLAQLSQEARRRLLRGLPLLADLPDEHIDRLAQFLRTRRVAAGSTVFRQDDPGEAVYFVVQGRVRIVMHADDGTEQLLIICEPGDAFGAVVLFDDSGYPATAEAVEDSFLVYLLREDFVRLSPSIPGLARSLTGVLGDRLRRAHTRLLRFSASDAEGRLAELLLHLIDDEDGYIIRRPPTHQEMANYIGSARETVSRIIARWRRQGWVISDERGLVISRPDLLQR